jgi:hypothetical protein
MKGLHFTTANNSPGRKTDKAKFIEKLGKGGGGSILAAVSLASYYDSAVN